ncbi:hypothetical protein CR513_51253, partial [Mucuna pruriens]
MEELQEDEDEEDKVQEIARLKSGKRPTSSTKVSSSTAKKKNVNIKGLLDLHFFKKPEETILLGKNKRQTSINDAYQKEARAKTIQYIARFFYRNGIPFNVTRSNSFKLMIEAVGNYGSHLKSPSYHELRVPLLKKDSSRCKHNWRSAFEHIHSKKRSRLEHQKLQELIVGELDGDGEDVEDELVFDDDVLTWRDVASAIGAAKPLMYTRRQIQMQRAVVASTSRKEKGKGMVEEEDEDESSPYEGEEEYNSSSNGSDEDNGMELQEDGEDLLIRFKKL